MAIDIRVGLFNLFSRTVSEEMGEAVLQAERDNLEECIPVAKKGYNLLIELGLKNGSLGTIWSNIEMAEDEKKSVEARNDAIQIALDQINSKLFAVAMKESQDLEGSICPIELATVLISVLEGRL